MLQILALCRKNLQLFAAGYTTMGMLLSGKQYSKIDNLRRANYVLRCRIWNKLQKLSFLTTSINSPTIRGTECGIAFATLYRNLTQLIRIGL